MFIFMHILDPEPEERVRQPSRYSGVREVCVDDEDGDEGEDDAEAETVEAVEGVGGPDYTIVVGVEEVAVLLQDCLV